RIGTYRRPRSELGRGAFARRVQQAAQDADVLHLEQVETAWCDAGVSTPSVLHLHYLVRRDRSFGPIWSKQFRDVFLWSRAERIAIRRHRYIIASSPLVADAIRAAAPGAAVVLAPPRLDERHYRAAPRA